MAREQLRQEGTESDVSGHRAVPWWEDSYADPRAEAARSEVEYRRTREAYFEGRAGWWNLDSKPV